MKHFFLGAALAATALTPANGATVADPAPAARELLKEACPQKDKAAPTASAAVDIHDYRLTVTVSPAVTLIMQDTAFDGPDWRKTLDCAGERALAARISHGKVELRFQALVHHPAQKEPRYVAFTDSFALKDMKNGAISRQKDGVTYSFALKT